MSKFDKVRGETIELDPVLIKANRRVWDAVAQTDPDFTKLVSYGRKFTAIDGYYNVLRATELWGPFGEGWGYDLKEETIFYPGVAIVTAKVKLTLWYGDGQTRRVCGPVIATNQLVSDKGHVDDEAFKKATTDALTKTLSYLGFSADVFLGAFDDNRYVEKRKEEVKAAKTRELPAALTQIVGGLKDLKTLPELEAAFYTTFGNKGRKIERHKDIASCDAAQVSYLQLQFAKRKAELSPEEPAPAEAADAA
jgi:hypothetical protein